MDVRKVHHQHHGQKEENVTMFLRVPLYDPEGRRCWYALNPEQVEEVYREGFNVCLRFASGKVRTFPAHSYARTPEESATVVMSDADRLLRCAQLHDHLIALLNKEMIETCHD